METITSLYGASRSPQARTAIKPVNTQASSPFASIQRRASAGVSTIYHLAIPVPRHQRRSIAAPAMRTKFHPQQDSETAAAIVERRNLAKRQNSHRIFVGGFLPPPDGLSDAWAVRAARPHAFRSHRGVVRSR